VFRAFYWWNIQRVTQRFLKEGRPESLVGERALVLEEDALLERSRTGDSRTAWWSVQDVVRTERYIFVYVTSMSAHVIPRSAFTTPSEEAAFVEEIARRRDESRAREAQGGSR
jgi:hypothetical protein